MLAHTVAARVISEHFTKTNRSFNQIPLVTKKQTKYRSKIFRKSSIRLQNKCSIYDISAQHNPRRSQSAQKKNELHSAFIKKKFVCEVNSFAFNGNSLRWEHDCIFALPLRLSVNHYYKQVISAQSQ